jgi:outer membrane beta-barrel protein
MRILLLAAALSTAALAAQDAAPEAESASTPTAEQPQGAIQRQDPKSQELVSGAPLYDPNVSVHIVQQKQFTDSGRHELALYPATAQVNGKFTQHYGSALSYTYHLSENLGLQLAPLYNWSASESDFNLELVQKVRQQGQPASTLLLDWGLMGGVEVTPLYGKFAFYDSFLGQFAVVLSGGAGLGQTRHLLKPPTVDETGKTIPATYGDTGQRFIGSVGGGVRVQLGKRFAARIELRDLVYTARVDQVNGCNAADLNAMFEVYDAGSSSLAGVPVRSSCRVSSFQGVDPRTGEDRVNDVPRARDLVLQPSSDALNNLGIYAGFSVLF